MDGDGWRLVLSSGKWWPAAMVDGGLLGVPTVSSVSLARHRAVPASYRVGMARLPVKIASTSVLTDDGGVLDVVFLLRHRRCRQRHLARATPGETLDLGLPKRTTMALCVVLPLGSIILEEVLTGGAHRWSGVTSSVSKTTDLGGVAQWSLGVECMYMDSRRRIVLSGVVVTSMAERPGKVGALIPLDDGTTEDCGSRA